MKFNTPTLVTITASTCSGKSFLLDALVEKWFSRIVSTTTRAPRAGEIHGVHYYFISLERSRLLEEEDKFAELVEFQGIRYGVTKHEMLSKISSTAPPVIIVEPQGLKIYEEYCADQGYEIFKIYVHTTEKTRIERLNWRTFHEVLTACTDENNLVVKKIIETHSNRLLSITGDERCWYGLNNWDVVVTGEDLQKAVAGIEQGIKWRNSRNAPLST